MSADVPYVWARPLAIGIAGGALMFALGIRHEAHAQRAAVASSIELRVPRAHQPLKIDGELDESDWTRAPARTGAFLGAGGATARPFTDARVLWDEKNLYLSLYAADEDIRPAKVAADGPVWTGDVFSLVFSRTDGTSYAIDVGPSGIMTDGKTARGGKTDYAWQSGAKVAIDVDGTPDDPSDRDEEWVVEMAIPLASLGLEGRVGERIGFGVRRCDTVDKKRVCGSWGQGASPGVLVLE